MNSGSMSKPNAWRSLYWMNTRRRAKTIRPHYALEALVEKEGVGAVHRESHCVDGFASDASYEFGFCSVRSLHVDDFDTAEARIAKLVAGTDLAGAFEFYRAGSHLKNVNGAPYRAIEIHHDVTDIPPGYADALDVRNQAMDRIETALVDADAGEWSGVERGMGEANFGFAVSDFGRAEKVLCAAVVGTPFACIREITRSATAADA